MIPPFQKKLLDISSSLIIIHFKTKKNGRVFKIM